MRLSLLTCLFLWASFSFAQAPIFDPGMTITGIGVIDSPVGEEVDKIIDGTTATKFLDFELADGMGFTVDLGGVSAIATQMEVWTANDFPVRDPMNFEILGSNDGSSFVSLDTGTIDCITDRFFLRTFKLTNTIDFQYYQINFTNACDPSGGTGIPSMQLAEVQLLGEVLSVPDNVLNQAVKLYPNPALDHFILDYSGVDPITELELFDIQGRRVMSFDAEGIQTRSSFEVAQHPAGIYFLHIGTDSARTVKRLSIQ